MKYLYTPEEAAEALGLGRTTIFQLTRSGRLASVKIGKSRRIPVDAIERFICELSEARQ